MRESSAASRDKLVLSDGMEGRVHIEWLLLRPEGIQVVETLEGAGQLIAGDALPHWTLIGRRRFVFPSPLPELERKLTGVRLLAGKTPVHGLIVMSDKLTLPRAHPQKLTAFAELDKRLAPLTASTAIPPAYAQAWDRLVATARSD